MPLGTPRLALSVRQPWAWAIIHAGKDIENRSWQAVNHGLKMRGEIVIHASKGMSRSEYEDAADFMDSINVACPRPDDLLRGCIIGRVEVIDVVKESESPWFFGPRGIVLQNPQPITPLGMCPGQLGYFKWHESSEPIPEPLPWMKAWPGSHKPARPATPDMPLFS